MSTGRVWRTGIYQSIAKTNKKRDKIKFVMSVTSTYEIKLTKTKSGVLRIGKTRVSLDSVITAFNQGATPEQIVYDFDTLTLAEVYAAISYYLQNRETVDSYLAKRVKQNEKLREATESRFNHQGIREKLLARRRNGL